VRLGALAGLLVLAAAGLSRAAVRSRHVAAVSRRLPAPASDVHRRVGRRPSPPAWLSRHLADAALDLDAAVAWQWWRALSLVAVLAAAWWGGAALAALALAAVAIGPLLALRTLRGRGPERYAAQLPACLEAVARGLRSGASTHQALTDAARDTGGAAGRDLAAVVERAREGMPLVDALEAWAHHRPHRLVRLSVAALALGIEAGGPQARAIDGVAATARDRLAVDAELRALSSQARASAAVIGIAPLAFCAVSTTADARTAQFLFRTPLGLAVLAAGLVLDAIAALWMAHITRAAR
jgi:tight adherence protein B